MKREGSFMIETAAAVMMAVTCITIGMSVYISSINTYKERILAEDLKLALYNTENEIKYNLSYDEIKEFFGEEKEILLEYNEDYNKKLIASRLNDMEKGNNITITVLDNEFKEFSLKGKIDYKDKSIEECRNFSKSWWMNEI